MLCSQPAILYSKYQFLSDSSCVHPALNTPCRSPRSWTQMKVTSRQSLPVNLYPSTKMIVSVIKNVYICLFFTAGDVFLCEKAKRARWVLCTLQWRSGCVTQVLRKFCLMVSWIYQLPVLQIRSQAEVKRISAKSRSVTEMGYDWNYLFL